MNFNLPIHQSSPSQRNRDSRNYFTTSTYTTQASPPPTSPSGAEAINGAPVREPARESAPIGDRLIVGVDFGTTFSG
jgi:hypothetical protein